LGAWFHSMIVFVVNGLRLMENARRYLAVVLVFIVLSVYSA
jgi:hypothetical protein